MAWCPIGYVCIPEISDACEAATKRLLKGIKDYQSIAGPSIFELKESTPAAIGIDPSDELYALMLKDEAELSVHGTILAELLRGCRNDAVACSPSGQLYGISGFLLDPPIFNPWFQIDKTYGKRPEFRYIDIYTGLIDMDNAIERLARWWDEARANAWLPEYKKKFSHLNGWSVCFPRDKIALDTDSLMKLWAPYNSSEFSTVGRPRKQEALSKAYKQAFPNGHGSLTYKQVLETLDKEHGVSASTDTLQRALGIKK